ncbi:N-6 DNA methylase [Sporosarcina contaminans]|uniref:N-6 DNA methylase n=1 Tax=Sporosarcina contaminans TaxID=633403 RepID=A0ABW3TSG3_9BACL
MDHVKEMAKRFNSMRYKHGVHQVFEDFLELIAITISNSVDLVQYKRREARYMQIIGQYDKSEVNIFPEMMARLIMALEHRPDDYLGRLFMELELYDSWKGQFFTPMSVSQLMAELTLQDSIQLIEEKGFVTVNEPTVGGGVTIIALFNALRAKGYNPQQVLRVIAQDIDKKAVHMSYIQFSLLGMNAEVLHGDTLALTFYETWKTPGNIFRWGRGLAKKQNAVETLSDLQESDLRQLTIF